jgi:hypothetical protein
MHQMHLVKPTTHRTDESLPDRYAAARAHVRLMGAAWLW